MIKATSKLGLGLVLLSLILAGCSTTTQEEKKPAPKDESTRGVQFPTQPESEPEYAVEIIPTVFYFDFDQSFLNQEARDALKSHAENFEEQPSMITLEGHADERGTREYNLALGERRAEAVRAFLVSQGVSENMISTKSYGEENPVATGSNERAWMLNRRVELKFN